MKDRVLKTLVRHGVRLAVMFVFLAGMAGLSRAQVPAASQPSPKAAASAASARTTSTEPQALSPAVPTRALQMYEALPMSFEANAGQSDPRVKFLAHAPGYSLFLTNEAAVLSLSEPSPALKPIRTGDPTDDRNAPQPQRVAHAVQVKFVGASAAAVVAGSQELPSKSNYFIGNDPKQWHTKVPNYSSVKYNGIYPGVDAVFHGDNRRFEFDFDIAAGADPHSIALEVDGARRMRLNRAGDLVLAMDAAHQLVMNKPHIYQESSDGRREIAGRYVLAAGNRIAFKIGPYDHTQPLVIDPTLVYSTYLDAGGTTQAGGTLGNAVAVDNASLSTASHGDPIDCSAGCAVVTGMVGTSTLPFPTTSGSYDPGSPPETEGWCNFVSKLNPDGSALVYSTYFCGEYEGDGADEIFAIAVDSTGAAYFGGVSESYDNTPTTPGSYEPVRPSDYPAPFVTKLSPDGSTLVYSTFLDGPTTESDDSVSGIAVDSSFSAYVTGFTSSASFPTTAGAFETVYPAGYGQGSAFVTKLSADGSSLVYSTFLGGSGIEDISGGRALGAIGGIALDSSNDAYVTGDTSSSNFPTKNPYIATCSSPCTEAFVSELNPTGTGLVFSTFLGGSKANQYSYGLGIAVDPSNCTSLSAGESCAVFVGGETSYTDFPVTANAVQSSPGEGFITKLAPGGTGLVYSSYFNGDVESVAVGPDDSAVLFGLSSTDLPFESTAGALTLPTCAPETGESGCFFDFISKLTVDGTGLIFSTPIGANQECCGAYGALDSTGDAYIVGSTSSTQLPTTAGSFEPTLPSGSTASAYFYVAKIAFSSSTSSITISPSTLPYGFEGESYFENFTATGGSGTGYTWSVTSGTALSAVGLSLTSGGVISGYPNATETAAPFTVEVTDSLGNTATQNYTLTIYPDILTTPTTLPTGIVGTPYSQMLSSSGGAGGPFSYSVASGAALSAVGLTLSPAGLISGTPSATETAAPLVIQVADMLGNFTHVNYSLTINSTAAPLTISPTTLPAATAGTPYSQTLTASGGSLTGYTWSIIAGAANLQSNYGLILSPTPPTAVIVGIPSAAGQVTFTVQVTDSLGDNAMQTYTLTIGPILSPASLIFLPQASGTTSAPQTVTLSNPGSNALSISGISISGANAADFLQTNTCGTGVAPTSNCTISVTFAPSLSAGSETATLNASDNAGTQQVGLTGIALPPPSVSCNIPTIALSGDSGTAQITCTATDFTGTIALECNLPASLSQYITCSFSPSSLNFASSSTASTTLTIQQVQGASLERKSWPWAAPTGGVAFGTVLWLPAWAFVMRRKKGRSKRGLLLMLILLCGLPMISSCGGKSKGPATPPAGTYQASVVLTGPGLNETITFTIQEP